jgi:hypothetical protein
VLITLLNEKGDTVEKSVRTDANGKFVLRTKDPGMYRIRATRLAFAPAQSSLFDLKFRTMAEARLVLSRQAVLLDPTVVIATRVMTGADMMSAEGYEFRKLRYTGVFTDTGALRRAAYPPLASHLRDVTPGMYFAQGFFGNEEIRITVLGNECVPDLYRDGSPQPSLSIVHINDTSSKDFYGVEVYKKPNIPIDFHRTGLECGVIAIWTKWYAMRGGI